METNTQDFILDSATESVKDYAILTLDTDRKVVTWSAGAEQILGYTETEIVGMSGDDLFIPEDQAADIPKTEVQTALKEGRAINERWHLRKDGSRFWGSGITHPLRNDA